MGIGRLPRPAGRPALGGIRARLLVPLLILIPLAVAALALVEDTLAAEQDGRTMSLVAGSVQAGVAQRLSERQRAKEIFAQLLAEEPGLADWLEVADQDQMARLLVPLKARVGLDRISVFDNGGTEVLRLAESRLGAEEHAPVRDLVAAALAGVTSSGSAAGGKGVLVTASAPVKGADGVAGALVVGAELEPASLRGAENERVDLAVFRRGELAGTTLTHPQVVEALAAGVNSDEELRALVGELARLHLHASARPLPNQGLLLITISTGELHAAAAQLDRIRLLATAVLIAALLAVVLLFTRAVASCLTRMVAVTQDIAAGDYGRRVAPSGIAELDRLADAVNSMGEQLEKSVSELSHRASHDPLTGLPNRVLFTDRVEHALKRAARGEPSLAVLFLDVDNFKLVNDTYGHSAGDDLLVEVGAVLQTCVREGDSVARLGGDEFGMLLEDVPDSGQAVVVAQRVLERLGEPLAGGDRRVSAAVSIGIALAEGETVPAETLLCNADIAMYEAKRRGKGRYEIFSPEMAHAAAGPTLREPEPEPQPLPGPTTAPAVRRPRSRRAPGVRSAARRPRA